MFNEFLVYYNRKNKRYGFATKEYAYKSDTFLKDRTILLETSFEIADEIVKVLRK